MPTAAEIIAQLNALPAEEHTEAITTLVNDGGAVVRAFRSRVFADGKKEGAKSGTEAAQKLAEATERAATAETELADLKAKTPDAKAIEERVTAKWEPKVKAAEQARDAAVTELRTERRKLTLGEFTAALTAKLPDGTQVDPEWVKDVAESRWGSRIVVKEDGSIGVLNLTGDTEYAPGEGQSAVALLAADARKAVPARYVLVDGDTGAGITNHGHGTGGGYDPVKAGLEAAKAQKADAQTNELAFR